MARSEVGTWTTLMPRRYMAAERPAMSPVTPPPSATTQSSRVRPRSARPSRSHERVRMFLLFSPASKTRLETS